MLLLLTDNQDGMYLAKRFSQSFSGVANLKGYSMTGRSVCIIWNDCIAEVGLNIKDPRDGFCHQAGL